MDQETFKERKIKEAHTSPKPVTFSDFSFFKVTVWLCFIYVVHSLTLKREHLCIEFAFEIISLKHRWQLQS